MERDEENRDQVLTGYLGRMPSKCEGLRAEPPREAEIVNILFQNVFVFLSRQLISSNKI